MTILICSDLHFNDNTRDSYRHRWMEKLPKLVQKYKVKVVLVLGDLTDEKDRHASWLVNTIAEHFYNLSKVCDIIILKGNHDYLSDADNPFYRFLNRINNICWINEPTDYREFSKIMLNDSGPFLFLPHTHNYKKDWKDIDFSEYDYIFTHNTFDNADVGHGRKLRGIPINTFTKGLNIISGDIHVPQVLNSNITYVGAPYTIDFGDSYDPRILLLREKKLISIPCEGSQKQLIECVAGQHISDDLPLLCKGDILKIRMQVTMKQMDKWSEIKDELRKWGDKHEYVIDSIQPVFDKIVRMSKKVTPEKIKTDEETLLEYAKMQNIDERTLKVGLKLLQKG